MKKTIYGLFLLLWGTTSYAQPQRATTPTNTGTQVHYYYTGSTKVYPTLNTKCAFVYSEDKSVLENLRKSSGITLTEIKEDPQIPEKVGYYAELRWSNEMSQEDYLKVIGDIKKNSSLYISPCFKKDGEKIGLSNYLNVKLKDEADLALLQSMAKMYKLSFIDHGKYFPKRWMNLRCDADCDLNALEMANLLYETGKFEATYPEFMPENIKSCSLNDTYFPQQWGLYNTGQNSGTPGVDINACEAWNITTGNPTVTIGVLDEGIQMDHPDLDANIDDVGYDLQGGFNQSGAIYSGVRGSHGTAVAGIIGAVANNGVGVTGVAPGCKMVSISIGLEGATLPINPAAKLAQGIIWAYSQGNAAVINNSWGNNAFINSPITDAINEAVTNGRLGKGTVVVCAAGNKNQSIVEYPSTLPNVLSVGAISPCGQRKSLTSCDGEPWSGGGSNYGNDLDITAPGVFIYTTDNDINTSYGYNPSLGYPNNPSDLDYYAKFNGTSAATPYVSGVAALMLSVNPCMTEKEVRRTIEITGQKLGGYAYSSSLAKPNGTWHQEMGYGVIDAYKAVKAAQELHSATLDLYIKDVPEDFGAEPASYPYGTVYASNDIWTRQQADGVEQQQNIVYDPSNPTAYVYVRVRNKSCQPSLGTEKLFVYFAKGGTFASWTAPWTNTVDNPPFGRQIGMITLPMIPAGGEAIVPVTWNNVPDPQNYASNFPPPNQELIHHFCLLARIVAANDPMYLELPSAGTVISVLGMNIHRNNNVAMKNLNIVNFERPNGILADHAAITIGNLSSTKQIQRLHLFSPSSETGNLITQEAEVTLILDNQIWQLWQAGGALSNGLRVLNEETHELLVTEPNATLNNLAFEAGALGDIALRFNFLTEQSSEKINFLYDVTQEDNVNGEIANGSRYQIIKPGREELFLSAIDTTVSMMTLNGIALSANDIQEPATYHWYSADSTLVDSGMNISCNQTQMLPAFLEVVAFADGFKDYAPVNVPGLLNGGILISLTNSLINLSPNPASGQVTVHYYLNPNVQNAEIRFTVINNPALVQTAMLDVAQTQKIVTIPTLSPGIYIVSLYCDGLLKDSKQLIVQ